MLLTSTTGKQNKLIKQFMNEKSLDMFCNLVFNTLTYTEYAKLLFFKNFYKNIFNVYRLIHYFYFRQDEPGLFKVLFFFTFITRNILLLFISSLVIISYFLSFNDRLKTRNKGGRGRWWLFFNNIFEMTLFFSSFD